MSSILGSDCMFHDALHSVLLLEEGKMQVLVGLTTTDLGGVALSQYCVIVKGLNLNVRIVRGCVNGLYKDLRYIEF